MDNAVDSVGRITIESKGKIGTSSDATSALLALATKESDGGRRKLFNYELQTFESSFQAINRSAKFHQSYIQVLQVALTHGNYDLVRRLLSKTNHQPGFLCCQLPILQDAVCGYAGSKTFGLSSEGHPLPEIIGSLLRHGALVDTRDTNGKSPLLCACELGYPCTFDVLLEAGADVQETTLGNKTDAQHAPRTTNLLQVALARFRKSVHMWPAPSYWA